MKVIYVEEINGLLSSLCVCFIEHGCGVSAMPHANYLVQNIQLKILKIQFLILWIAFEMEIMFLEQ